MSYRNVSLWLGKATVVITALRIKNTELETVRVNGLTCLMPTIEVNPECFVRLCCEQPRRPSIKREDDFLYGEFRAMGFAITTAVWSKSQRTDHLRHWQTINDLAKPMLEVDRPKIGVKRIAIEDKRRPLGLPAPKVIDV